MDVWSTDERRGFDSAKKLDNINDACIECIKMSDASNVDNIIKKFNLELNREITDSELLEFASDMNYTPNSDEFLFRVSTYSPGDCEILLICCRSLFRGYQEKYINQRKEEILNCNHLFLNLKDKEYIGSFHSSDCYDNPPIILMLTVVEYLIKSF